MIPRTLTDAQWRRIERLVPGKKGGHGRPARDNRLFVEACLWRARHCARWSELPEDFGSWKLVYLRFRRWSRSGVWAVVLEALRDEADIPSSLFDEGVWSVKLKPRSESRHVGQGAD